MPKAIEVEIRILLKNRRKIEDNLKNSGAKVIYFTQLKDYWYCPKNVKNYQNASIDKTGFALRIRETTDKYSNKKSAALECKTLYDGKNHALCHEHEIDLPNVAQTRKILEDIGLKEFLIIDKERTIYQYRRFKCCFDKINGIGQGLEIEMLAKNNLKKAYDKIISFAKTIGINDAEILDKSLTYLAMKKLSKF